MPKLDIVCLGVGAGATAVYDLEGNCSSAFLLKVDAVPVLLLDVVRWPTNLHHAASTNQHGCIRYCLYNCSHGLSC
jgi:hypothetical protein